MQGKEQSSLLQLCLGCLSFDAQRAVLTLPFLKHPKQSPATN